LSRLKRRSDKHGRVGRAMALPTHDEAEEPPKTKRLFRQRNEPFRTPGHKPLKSLQAANQ
jgi:hypothetical protein